MDSLAMLLMDQHSSNNNNNNNNNSDNGQQQHQHQPQHHQERKKKRKQNASVNVADVLKFPVQTWAKLCIGQNAERLVKRFLELREDNPGQFRPKKELYCALLRALGKDTTDPRSLKKALEWLEKYETDPAVEVDIYAYNCVMLNYAYRGDVHGGMAFFQSIPFQKDSYTYGLMIKTWANSRRPNKAAEIHRLFEELKATFEERLFLRELMPTAAIYGAVMAESSAKQAQQLLTELHQLYDKFQDAIVQPTVRHYVAVMNAWVKEKNPMRAEKVLMEMMKLYENGFESLQPNQHAFVVALDGWAKQQTEEGDRRAERLLEILEDHAATIKGFNNFGHNILMDTYSRKPNGVAKIEQMFWRMEKLAAKHNNNHVLPNTVSYTTLLCAWSNSQEDGFVHKMEQILERMERNKRTRPDNISYSAVMNGWLKSGHKEAQVNAINLLKKMRQPDSACFNILINIHMKYGDPEEAEGVLQWMNHLAKQGQSNVKPTNKEYSACINAWATGANEDEAWPRSNRLFDEMLLEYENGDQACKPTSFSYTPLFVALGRSDVEEKAKLAVGIVAQMDKHNIQQYQITCNALINACATEKGSDRAKEEALKLSLATMELMRKERIEVNSITFNSIMHACYNLTSDSAESQKLLEHYFELCCKEGKVNSLVLRTFQIHAPESKVLEQIGSPVSELTIEDLPIEWKERQTY